MLDNALNQTFKFRTKNWTEINDQSIGTYNGNDQIKFKATTLKSSLYDYGDAYILVKEKITITEDGTDDTSKRLNERNKEIYIKIVHLSLIVKLIRLKILI